MRNVQQFDPTAKDYIEVQEAVHPAERPALSAEVHAPKKAEFLTIGSGHLTKLSGMSTAPVAIFGHLGRKVGLLPLENPPFPSSSKRVPRGAAGRMERPASARSCATHDVSFSNSVRRGRLNLFAASVSCPIAMFRSPFYRSRTSRGEATMRGSRAVLCRLFITEVARFPALGVIAAESVFAAGFAGLDDAGLGRRLKVAYLLKGSVRRSRERYGSPCNWWKRPRASISGRSVMIYRRRSCLESQIAAKIANALALRIDQTVLNASRRRKLPQLAVYECWLRGMECLQRGTVESDEEARVYFEQALAADPQYARAQAGLSLSHFNEWSCQAWECWEAKEKAAYVYARRAEALDPATLSCR